MVEINKCEHEAELWFENYQKNVEEKLKPKSFFGKLFYITKTDNEKELQKSTFLLGFVKGLCCQLTDTVYKYDKK